MQLLLSGVLKIENLTLKLGGLKVLLLVNDVCLQSLHPIGFTPILFESLDTFNQKVEPLILAAEFYIRNGRYFFEIQLFHEIGCRNLSWSFGSSILPLVSFIESADILLVNRASPRVLISLRGVHRYNTSALVTRRIRDHIEAIINW